MGAGFDKHGMREGAPFNSAIDTLMRISAQLDEIKQISIGIVGGTLVEKGLAQHIKYKAVNMLMVMAVPLLKQQKVFDLYDEFKTIKVSWVKKSVNSYSQPTIVEGYNSATDFKLNEFLMELQMELQKEGYFMPPKGDPRFAFSQD